MNGLSHTTAGSRNISDKDAREKNPRQSLVDALNGDLAREYQAIVTTRFATTRERVRQCESLGEYAIAEDLREILRTEQEHQIDLATALGRDVPNLDHVKPSRRLA